MTLRPRSRWAFAVCWLCALALCTPAGCGRSATRSTNDKEKPADEDPLGAPREVVRRALETTDYHRALEQVNKHLDNQPDALTRFEPAAAGRAALRQLLTERLGLDPDDLQEIDAGRFTPLDGHYLGFCCHLRDTARSLRLHERQGASAAEKTAQSLHQARVAFDWTMRQVMLEEKGGELTPPSFVLQQGHGGARERALIFLALLRQLGLDGCTIAFPGPTPEAPNYRLAGVLLRGEGGGVYLFDPRLGIPLPGPGGQGIATLTQLRTQKDLLAQLNLGGAYQYDVTPEQAGKAEVHLVFPLSALSPRMRYLEEEVFASHDRVHLALRPAEVLKRFTAAKVGPVKVWNRRSTAGQPPPVTPTRVLRLYLPPPEGGVDRRGRYLLHKERLTPWGSVFTALAEMKIYKQLPGEAGDNQIRYAVEGIFRKYIRAPREELARGRLEGAAKRLARILAILDDPLLAQADEADFQQKVKHWKNRVVRAFADRKKPGGQKVWDELWSEDQYLIHLASPSEEEVDPNKLSRSTLSEIVLRAAGGPLRRAATYLQALRWQEKAERLQARREQVEGSKGARDAAKRKVADDAAGAWENAQDVWGKHTHKFPFTAATLKARVRAVRAFAGEGDVNQVLAALQEAFQDLRRSLTARLWRARALVQFGKDREALAALRELVREAEAVETSPELQALRKDMLDQIANEAQRQALDSEVFGGLRPAGSLFWLRYRAQLEMRPLSGKAG